MVRLARSVAACFADSECQTRNVVGLRCSGSERRLAIEGETEFVARLQALDQNVQVGLGLSGGQVSFGEYRRERVQVAVFSGCRIVLKAHDSAGLLADAKRQRAVEQAGQLVATK